MNRECEVCLMRQHGFLLDYWDRGSGIHLGRYRCKYTARDGKKFYLWHSYLCFDCKSLGFIPSRNIFTAEKIEVNDTKKDSSR